MGSWPRPSSWQPGHRTDPRVRPFLLPIAVLLCAGCGHAEEHARPADVPRAASTPVEAAPPPATTAGDALCIPAASGALRARLQGAIDAELDWGEGAVHCQAGLRPQGDGLRLVYKGALPETGPLLLVFGIAPLRPGQSARNVPVNLTVVREGTGQFYATQGDDKCALDTVTQSPLTSDPRLFRLEGRGYCTQPARAVAGDGAVLLSRFDVVALVPVVADDVTQAAPATATEATQ